MSLILVPMKPCIIAMSVRHEPMADLQGVSLRMRIRRWVHGFAVAVPLGLLGVPSFAQVEDPDVLPDSDDATPDVSKDPGTAQTVPRAAWTAYLEGERKLRRTGMASDPAEACQHFDRAIRLAAPAVLPQAEYRVGLCHLYGWGRARDAAEAAVRFQRAAERGLVPAQTQLGVALLRGRGVERDPDAAASWLRRAAQAGHSSAMLALGLMMQAGQVPGSTARDGIDWLRRGAEAGDSSSAMMLAQAYRSGRGVVADPRSAGRWLQRAADARNPAAQLLLAQWYYEGGVVEPSALYAYVWARIADARALRLADRSMAARLSQRAQTILQRASARLSASQLLEAQGLARDWTPGSLALVPASEPGRADWLPGRSPPDSAQVLPPVSVRPPLDDAVPPRRAQGRTRFSAGSGFYVSREGHLVTNDHVVRDCRAVRLPDGQAVEVVGRDSRADLALLKARPVSRIARLRGDDRVRQGEDVATYGYPLHGVLSSSGQLGAGMITALTGLRDNGLQLQIDVPVQSGNSGGPLLDERGEVVGVVVSKLNALRVAQITGDIPQNVNFAVRLEPLRALLERHQVPVEAPPARARVKDRQSIAEEARAYTTAVLCERRQ
jgi:TPR repeat protein